MKRALIFAHYDRDGIIDPHVEFLLSELKKHTDKVVFVSTSAREAELERIRAIAEIAIARENVGYDFISWKLGYELLEDKADFDEVLFANDSVYGPVFDIAEIFKKMERKGYLFWGLVRSHEVEPHIQSYFFCFSRELICSGVADGFWSQVEIVEDKMELIKKYEVGLTRYISRHVDTERIGYIFDQFEMTLWQKLKSAITNGRWREKTYYKVFRSAMKKRRRNPCHQYWGTLLEAGLPFVKVELMRDNPEKIELARVYKFLERETDYPVRLINDHLARICKDDFFRQ